MAALVLERLPMSKTPLVTNLILLAEALIYHGLICQNTILKAVIFSTDTIFIPINPQIDTENTGIHYKREKSIVPTKPLKFT